MGLRLNHILTWYQGKIGAYNRNLWEESVECRILQGLSNIPKKTAKLKNELLDIDFIRGTSFPKLKPKHGFLTICRQSLFKLFFLPLYRNWWSRHTHPKAYWFLVAIYIIQMGSMSSYFLTGGGAVDDNQKLYFEGISPVEICVPLLMMLILTFILCQIVAGHSASPRLRKKLKGKKPKRQKRTLSENRRTLLTASGSKSSLDTSNNEGYNEVTVGTSKCQSFSQREKIRSFSEERVRTKRIPKKCQRSVSLNLDPGVLGRARRAIYSHNFLRWLRFRDEPTRPNEDEGFDSLNGNCSSSCDDGDVEVPRVIKDKAHKKREACADKVEKLLRWKSDEGTEEGVKTAEEVKVLFGETSPVFEDKGDGLIEDEEMLQENTDGIPVINILRNRSLPMRSQERQSNRLTPSVLTIPTARLEAESSYNSSCESDVEQTPAQSPVFKTQPGTTSVDWTGVTTNSEECSYSSESETDVENHSGLVDAFPDESGIDFYGVSALLHPSCCTSDKVSCTIWEEGDAKKVDLSALDISAAIIAKVDALPDSTDYLNGGVIAASLVAVLPLLYRLNWDPFAQLGSHVQSLSLFDFSNAISQIVVLICDVFDVILGKTFLEKFVVVSAALQRFVMGSCFLFLMAIAERTFKQRFLYAKLFSHLTSSRRARRSDVPHFRLNKVRNIKTWLSVRSFIKKRGPQHSIDCIVSASFMITLFLVSILCMELVKESQSIHQSLYNLEVLCWCLVLGVFLLRFMTLGSKINRKYRSLSVLITEQINLYLQMEQKPSKKEELLLSNNVLKLAADLLKELESPFKISGVSANPILYNLTKLVVLSAISGVLSEILGFKLKLHKLKLS